MDTHPNILFILADQHNAKVLGHQGHPDVQTPNLDRLAAEGVRFDNAITQNPICTPSRVCWFSGQYCHNHGYYGLSGPNPGGLPTVLGYFRRAGYHTSAIGKIHCPEYWIEDDADVFHETCECSIGGRSRAYTKFLRERGKEHLEDHGAMPEFGPRGGQSMEGRPSPLTFEESQEGWIAARTIDSMQSATAAGQPFFAYASLPRPHQCTAPSQPFWDLYDPEALHLPPNADIEPAGRAPHFQATVAMWRRGDWALIEPRTFEAARRRKLHGYLGAVSQVDHAVGRMLEFLDRAGLAENTIVIYSADHGDYACEHGIMEKAPGICSDAITRIPWIWRWPGRFQAGHAAREIVETVDLANTLCALADLPAMGTVDGRDISPLLHGKTDASPRIGVTENPWAKSVRKGRWRYVHYPRDMFPNEYPDGFGELYDLEADPWETRNLYFEAEYAAVVGELRDDLVDWLITTTRPVTAHPPTPGIPGQSRERYRHFVDRDGKMSPARIHRTHNRNYT